MEEAYQIKSGVYLVQGASRGAILDTCTGLVYSVNQQACEVCQYLVEDEPFWRTLISMGLAEPVQELKHHATQAPMAAEQLKFIWLEIVTERCNQQCIHCYTSSLLITAKNGALKTRAGRVSVSGLAADKPPPKMRYCDWRQVLEEARDLGCQACQFIGGEPFLYHGENGESVLDLAGYARSLGYSRVEIFTNGTLLTPAKIDRIKESGIKIAVSLYSDDPVVHDRITRTAGSHARTMTALNRLKKAGVETRLETVVLRANQDTIESTIAYRERMGFNGKKPDPLRPTGRGSDLNNQPDAFHLVKYGYKLDPNFKASELKIKHNQSGHPCLNGKLVVSENGDILPCIFYRDAVLGNYLEADRLSRVLNSPELQRTWHTTKDEILVCQDCEYRYVCFDCRPLAKTASPDGDLSTAPNPRCTYNPYTGQWGDGVWKLDQKGKPYYDQSLASTIQEVRQARHRSARV